MLELSAAADGDARRNRPARRRARWGVVFAAGSLLALLCLGIVAAALVSGRLAHRDGGPDHGFVDPWLSVFGLLCGAMLASLCAHVSAVYLCVEAESAGQDQLAGDFRIRTLTGGLVLPLTGWRALLAARTVSAWASFRT